jgi:uncharacterized protein YuzE
MSTLASIAPNLATEISAALSSEGRDDLSAQLKSSVIERCTYDSEVDAGYIYLVRPSPSLHFAKLATPIAETIPFLDVGFNIDVDHDGCIFGIEILSRADFFAKLRDANVL